MSTAALTPVPRMQFIDANGDPLAGGKVYSYAAGTNIALATFTDSTETSQNTNPIILDAAGQANIWLGASFYKIIVQDVNGIQISTTDNVSSYNLPFLTSLNFIEGAAPTGSIGNDLIYGDLVNHRAGMVNNGGTPDLIVGQNTVDTLSNKTLSAPVIHNPTIDAAIFSGTATGTFNFVGTALIGNLNGVRTVDGVTFTTIAQAIASLPANGAFIVHLPSGYRETFSTHIDLGNGTTQAVFLTMDSDVIVTCNVTDATYGFQVHDGSGIIGIRNQALTAGRGCGSVISIAVTCNVANVVKTVELPQAAITLEGFEIDNVLGGTVSNAFINIVNLNNAHTVRAVSGSYFPSIGIHVSATTGGVNSIGPVNVDNCFFDGTGLPGARPLVIESDGVGATNGVRISGGLYLNPGTNHPCIEINGNGGTQGQLRDVIISGVYTQQFPGTTGIIGIKIVDAVGVIVEGGEFQLTDGSTNQIGISIDQGGSGRTHSITVINFRLSSAGGNKGIFNNITGRTILTSSGNIPGYVYQGTVGTALPSGWIFDADTFVEIGGTISRYNNIPTVGSGIPSILAAADLTAQTAAITATTLYTPTASGLYRIIAYLKVTTVAGTSSTLGSVAIGFTDATDSVAQTLTMVMNTELGNAATANAVNTTASKLMGSVVINAKTGVPITYAVLYASNAAAAMNFEAHFKVEAL